MSDREIMRWEGPTSYHQLHFRHRAHQALHHDAAQSLLPPMDGLTLLDVGCGYGDFTGRLDAEMRNRYLGIDINKEVVQAARELNPGWKFRWQRKIWPKDVIVAIASISGGVVAPEVMLAEMWEKCSKALIFTVYEGFAPFEMVQGWCPKLPDVLLLSDDFFAGALYK